MQTAAKIFVISGPSGSGKSTLLKRLFNEYPDTFGFSVSHTTRKPRPGEVNGKDYHFVEKEKMQQEVSAGKFIESATFSGNMYGTSIKSVEDVVESGKVCMLDIDMQGVKSVKATQLNPRYIFVRPPSIEILEQRLRGRGTETEEAVTARLEASKRELEYGETQGAYDRIVINDDLEKAYNTLKDAIFVA
ncbi:guanylate kinase [Circinella umbellata]|nr:guanylate kinase [Circinella umbellata]